MADVKARLAIIGVGMTVVSSLNQIFYGRINLWRHKSVGVAMVVNLHQNSRRQKGVGAWWHTDEIPTKTSKAQHVPRLAFY